MSRGALATKIAAAVVFVVVLVVPMGYHGDNTSSADARREWINDSAGIQCTADTTSSSNKQSPPEIIGLKTFKLYLNTDVSPGSADLMELGLTGAGNESDCIRLCSMRVECVAFVYRETEYYRRCYFKTARTPRVSMKDSKAYIYEKLSVPPPVAAAAAARPSAVVTGASTVAEPSNSTTDLRHVVFGVMSAAKHLETRLRGVLETWLKGTVVRVYFEDDQTTRAAVANFRRTYRDFDTPMLSYAFLEEPKNHTVHGTGGAWKNFPVLMDLLESFPKMLWYATVDDDTFMIPHNLAIVLNKVDRETRLAKHPVYLGVHFLSCADCATRILFAQGGAGFLINRFAADFIGPKLKQCNETILDWAGDIRVGRCFKNHGVNIYHQPHFWSQNVFKCLGRDNRKRSAPFPVSFHGMTNRSWVLDTHESVMKSLADNDGKGPVTWLSLALHLKPKNYPDELYFGGTL